MKKETTKKMQRAASKNLWGKRGTGKVQKFSSKNKHTSKIALLNPMSKARVTLFGLNHKQQATWGQLIKPKIK
jgi:hypothetical protein